MSKMIQLVRARAGEGEAYINLFHVGADVQDVEAALRAAVEEFLSTPAGRQAIEETNYDFNWGDAIVYVPAEIWAKHGLKLLDTPAYDTVYVNQDEVLVPYSVLEDRWN